MPDAARSLRILAAEDNPMNQLVLKTLLNQVGVEPVMVADGRAAVEAWAHGNWDLILMDVQMPVMDGPTATGVIRAAEAAGDRGRTPIVGLTANAMSHQVAEYLGAGMDEVVAKPIEAARLYAVIEAALDAAGADTTAASAAA
jgi:CheY-like chemotaxis protein